MSLGWNWHIWPQLGKHLSHVSFINIADNDFELYSLGQKDIHQLKRAVHFKRGKSKEEIEAYGAKSEQDLKQKPTFTENISSRKDWKH